jgi:hypothetical protein
VCCQGNHLLSLTIFQNHPKSPLEMVLNNIIIIHIHINIYLLWINNLHLPSFTFIFFVNESFQVASPQDQWFKPPALSWGYGAPHRPKWEEWEVGHQKQKIQKTSLVGG